MEIRIRNVINKALIIFIFAVFLSSSQVVFAGDVNLTIRDGDNVVFTGVVPLPEAGTLDIEDSNAITHTINSNSVLSVIHGADVLDESWNISNLAFFDSFGSFYVKCLNSSSGEKCDNWQYVVDDNSTLSSVDQYILTGGETVYFYFGNPHQVVLSTDNLEVNQNLLATAQKYDYINNVWVPLTEVTIGVTTPNPDDVFSPIEVDTALVSDVGEANFLMTNAGEYDIGIKDDFYFPMYHVVVSPAPVSGGGSGGGGGGSTNNNSNNALAFDVGKAFAYLDSVKNTDGSFGAGDLYTDWAVVAYSAGDFPGNSRDQFISYFNSNVKNHSLLTDNERYALTLLALDENPYSFNGINYIDLILNEFDGTQFGDADLVNDDIFALFPLYGSGHRDEDELIKKDIAFIISKQNQNGSWEGSVDLTAAAIQALEPFDSLDGVSQSLNIAGDYIASKQNGDGGWGNISSTAWAVQAMNVLGLNWKIGDNTPAKYFYTKQEADGGVLAQSETKQNRIWSTSYVIPAVLGKSWYEIIHPVSKPKESKSNKEVKTEELPVVAEIPKQEIAPQAIKDVVVNKVVEPKSKITPKTLAVKTTPVVESVPKEEEAPVLVATPVQSKSQIPVKYIAILFVALAGFFSLRFFKFI
ncbi:MAG: hypothetical protein KBC06_00400 [Candidatus Pacebacteria bacterium]|nr:hypothetical protein [Candidatus Paceibacterota bacterium]